MIPGQIGKPRKRSENREKRSSAETFRSTGLPELSMAFRAFPQEWSSNGRQPGLCSVFLGGDL
jgi:hypothetical protein